ncbi:MAG: hypothetical protein EAS52_18335 [Parapedobacter sp.]|nr:MAG: hypothetical protein EAS52_18335 [Parapedobacter sp.]
MKTGCRWRELPACQFISRPSSWRHVFRSKDKV